MASLSCVTTANSINVYIVGLDTNYASNDRDCTITLSLNGGEVGVATKSLPANSSEVLLATFYGLTPNTTYDVECYILFAAGTEYERSATFYSTATTDHQTVTASYSVSCDYKSVTFNVSGISSGNVVRTVLRPSSTTYMLYSVDFLATSTSMSVTLPDDLDDVYAVNDYNEYKDNGCVPIDLTPKTDYVCRVYLYESTDVVEAGIFTDLGSKTFTTSAKPAVTEWDWTSSNGPKNLASAAQTQKAYAAITSKGFLSDFSHLVWNDLVHKVNEVITDRGGAWNTTYGTMEETLMAAADKVMSARRFNAVLWNLHQYVVTGITEKTSGDTVMGEYFIALANAVNNAIRRD